MVTKISGERIRYPANDAVGKVVAAASAEKEKREGRRGDVR
jgi:hypothetical protein